MSENLQSSQLSAAELRKRLMLCCDESEQLIKQAVEQHESLTERTRKDKLNLCRSLLSTLNDVLSAEDWSKSPFISKMVEPIQALKSELQQLEESLTENKKTAKPGSRLFSSARQAIDQAAGEPTTIFILLYQQDGPNIRKWAAQLKNLSQSIISRPIYGSEEEVTRMLKHRDHMETDAYIKMTIPSSILLDQGGEQRKDRLDQPLLALISNNVHSDAVEYFVYNGCTYRYQDEKLEKIDDNEADSADD